MSKFPFIERRIGSDHLLRHFSSDTSSNELVWHRDTNTRHVRVLEGAGWSLQLDDQLPKSMRLGDSYVIPAGGWHRLIRNDDATNLCVIIREHKTSELDMDEALEDLLQVVLYEKKSKKKNKGLWANIHAKRKRGERPAKSADKNYPDEKSLKSAQRK